jgi:signal transduction histidine kinase
VAVVALVLGIVLTAYLTTRPLFAFAGEIKEIGAAEDLGHRVGTTGFAEFDRLSATFNAMLERMQSVLVSHDRLDQENQARKKAERELRRSERRYRDVIEGSTRGIFICSGDTILFANQMLAAQFGFDGPDAVIASARVSDLFDADVCKALEAQIKAKQDATSSQEICMLGAGEAETWYENVARTTMWQGRVAVQCSLTDISGRKEVERLKNEFVSVVSHELRTPLTSVTGSLGLIQSGALGALPDKVEPLIKIAHSNTQRLVALVNDILDVEKIEAGHMEFHMEPVDATELGAQALAENVFYGAKFNVGFELQPEMAKAYVSADKDRLLQVLANLLSNAAKFSPQGGRVVLKLTEHDGAIRFSVIDEGAGIPEAKLETIFEKFKQADSSDSRAKAGTGLGLAICQSIAQHHGSRIEVSSVEGEGSTFYFELAKVAARAADGETSDTHQATAVAAG